MPVFPRQPRTLLSSTYAVSGTSTSTAAHGAALSTAWSGSFITSNLPVEVLIGIPYISRDTISNTVEVHVLVDGTCRIMRLFFCETANVGTSMEGRSAPITLAAGSHTVSVQVKVGNAATGTLAGTATDPNVLIVREVVS